MCAIEQLSVFHRAINSQSSDCLSWRGDIHVTRSVELHTQAAGHYEKAARHHGEAARHYEAGDHEKALAHARLANENHQLAMHQSEEADKAQIECGGDTVGTGPASPLSRKKRDRSAWLHRMEKKKGSIDTRKAEKIQGRGKSKTLECGRT